MLGEFNDGADRSLAEKTHLLSWMPTNVVSISWILFMLGHKYCLKVGLVDAWDVLDSHSAFCICFQSINCRAGQVIVHSFWFFGFRSIWCGLTFVSNVTNENFSYKENQHRSAIPFWADLFGYNKAQVYPAISILFPQFFKVFWTVVGSSDSSAST